MYICFFSAFFNTESTVEDFSVDQTKLFERFVKYQSQQAVETLKVLAQGRYYTREIFEKLVDRFKTAYPLTAFEEFNRYSFISKDANHYTLHNLMRESLIEVTPDYLKREIQTYLLEQYESVFSKLKLKDLKSLESEPLKEALEEAYYLKGLLVNHIERTSWLNSYFKLFDEGAKYSVLFDLLKEDIEGFSQERDEASQKALATSLNNLAELYLAMGEYDKALPLYQKSLKIREEVLGEMHPDMAESYNNLALLYETMGEYEKALPLYQKSLKIREEVLEESHSDTAASYNNLALLYKTMGEYEKALPLYQKSLKISEEVLGEMHPSTATSYNNLAALYDSMGEYEKALPLYQKSLKIREEVLGEMHPSTAASYNNLARLYESKEEYDKAYEYMQKAIEILEKSLPAEHPHLSGSKRSLARIKEKLEQVQER